MLRQIYANQSLCIVVVFFVRSIPCSSLLSLETVFPAPITEMF